MGLADAVAFSFSCTFSSSIGHAASKTLPAGIVAAKATATASSIL